MRIVVLRPLHVLSLSWFDALFMTIIRIRDPPAPAEAETFRKPFRFSPSLFHLRPTMGSSPNLTGSLPLPLPLP